MISGRQGFRQQRAHVASRHVDDGHPGRRGSGQREADGRRGIERIGDRRGHHQHAARHRLGHGDHQATGGCGADQAATRVVGRGAWRRLREAQVAGVQVAEERVGAQVAVLAELVGDLRHPVAAGVAVEVAAGQRHGVRPDAADGRALWRERDDAVVERGARGGAEVQGAAADGCAVADEGAAGHHGRGVVAADGAAARCDVVLEHAVAQHGVDAGQPERAAAAGRRVAAEEAAVEGERRFPALERAAVVGRGGVRDELAVEEEVVRQGGLDGAGAAARGVAGERASGQGRERLLQKRGAAPARGVAGEHAIGQARAVLVHRVEAAAAGARGVVVEGAVRDLEIGALGEEAAAVSGQFDAERRVAGERAVLHHALAVAAPDAAAACPLGVLRPVVREVAALHDHRGGADAESAAHARLVVGETTVGDPDRGIEAAHAGAGIVVPAREHLAADDHQVLDHDILDVAAIDDAALLRGGDDHAADRVGGAAQRHARPHHEAELEVGSARDQDGVAGGGGVDAGRDGRLVGRDADGVGHGGRREQRDQADDAAQ